MDFLYNKHMSPILKHHDKSPKESSLKNTKTKTKTCLLSLSIRQFNLVYVCVHMKKKCYTILLFLYKNKQRT